MFYRKHELINASLCDKLETDNVSTSINLYAPELRRDNDEARHKTLPGIGHLKLSTSSDPTFDDTMATTAPICSISFITILLCCFAIPDGFFFSVEAVDNRPIVGILTQELSVKLKKNYPGDYNSYIAASYVKFIEGAGGRVVPIWIGQDVTYYENIISKVNGILWPGGSTYFNHTKGYADAGDIIYRIAKRINANGDYFPIFGICLGMELLTYVAADRVDHRIDCSSRNQPLPLKFKLDFRDSKLFSNSTEDVIEILTSENVTANYHRYCITEDSLKSVHLNNQFHVLSSNHDKNGVQFISALEHVSLPFYGLQFHPEKNTYEWVTGKKIPHGLHATVVSQYFANFFVNEARKSTHKFLSADEEAAYLIYNYPATYTGLKKSSYVQSYLFTRNDSATRYDESSS